MTDNEIIKGLEYCSKQGITSECEKCKVKKGCRAELIAKALDLINRQKAEVERLEEMLDSAVSSEANTVDTTNYMIAEAVKEFAERLKKEIDIRTTLSKEQDRNVLFLIDNLLKETVGDAK